MKSLTITLLTLPNGTLSVRTDGDRPAVGHVLTASQALHLDLMRLCAKHTADVQYGPATVPLIALACEMVDREGYGHCLPADAHGYVQRILDGGAA